MTFEELSRRTTAVIAGLILLALAWQYAQGNLLIAPGAQHYVSPLTPVRELPDGFSVLVGQGCEGPDPIAVAVEEDLLPICKRIDVHEVALGE